LGEALSGPLEGTRLNQKNNAIVAFWFAWGAFYPQTEIYAEGTAISEPPAQEEDESHPLQSNIEIWDQLKSQTNYGD
jgi:hypothetical protein